MSTRCHVLVENPAEKDEDNKILLYRHCDGYPTIVLPSILRAFQMSDATDKGYGWQAGRVLKVAGFIIAEGFRPKSKKAGAYDGAYIAYEPLPYKQLHGDVEWLYRVQIKASNGVIQWFVKVLRPTKKFWAGEGNKEAIWKNTRTVAKGYITEIGIEKSAKEIEEKR